MNRTSICMLLLGAAWAPILMPAPAAAAGSAVAPAASATLDEVVVTARRREENLQDTPVSVTALSGPVLKAARIEDFTRIGAFAPGLQTSTPSVDTSISMSIRGIGTFDPLLTNEPAVAVYIDGVYVNALTFGQFDLIELERVEVLRGPQGTLFGRNTTGGALNITTRRPSDHFGVQAVASYATNNEIVGRAILNTGEFAPGWRGSIAFQHRQLDGYVDDITLPADRDPGASEANAFRAALDGDLGRLKVRYTFDLVRRRGVAQHNQYVLASDTFRNFVSQSQALGGDPLRVSPDFLDTVNQADVPRSRHHTDNHALTLIYEASPQVTLKSITGYRKWSGSEENVYGSSAGLRLPIVNLGTGVASVQTVDPFIATKPSHLKQFSQEVQVLGSYGKLNFVLGGFFFNADYDATNPQNFLVVTPFPSRGVVGLLSASQLQYDGRTRSYAGFGSVNYRPEMFDDRLEISAGLRYTEDRKDLNIHVFPGGRPPALNTEQNAGFHNTSYNISLDYRLATDVSAYARVGTGYRAGGANPRSFSQPAYGPEKAIVYEAGLKSEWFDRRLRANLSAYHTDYRDLQITQLGFDPVAGTVTVTLNAGKATFDGFEAELAAVPMDGLRLTGGLAYVDPKYGQYLVGGVDLKDQAKFPIVSKWSGNVGAAYTFPATTLGVVRANLDYAFKSREVFEPLTSSQVFLPNARDMLSEGFQQDLSAVLTLSDIPLPSGGRGEMSMFGRNLLDKHYRNSTVDFGQLGYGTANFSRGRVIGVEARVEY